MRPVKNKRRIDPRYFLNETANDMGDNLDPEVRAIFAELLGILETLAIGQPGDNAQQAAGGQLSLHNIATIAKNIAAGVLKKRG